MSAATRSRPGPAAGPEGFTLAEMLVALAGASLLGAALIGLLASQSRFHLRNEDGIQAAQTTRALLDGMGAEIRGAGSADLLQATPDTVSLRFDVLRTIVCDTVGGGGADLFVYDSVSATNLRSRWRGTAVSGPYAVPWIYADGFTPVSGVSADAEATCRAAGADRANQASARQFRRASGWGGRFGATPPRGALARVYGRLTYSIRASSSEPGTLSIRRNGQEFALPLGPGASFEYGMSDGTTQARVASGDLSRVAEVRLVATAIGRNRLGAGRRISHPMPLRN
ncbi:hypothetical protein [Candidatus Palauibacter sp.]|uniref:hypothetical protein n=1 Tax=Candidatus Palauibacter sp. TaxID=3101350 RepID=UPI003AF2EB00